MGNCLHRSRGDGGGAAHHGKNSAALLAAAAAALEHQHQEEEETHGSSEKAPAPVTTEVKIRITRKQLEDLLRRLDEKNSGGAVVVTQLLRMARSVQWRPALQSIPE